MSGKRQRSFRSKGMARSRAIRSRLELVKEQEAHQLQLDGEDQDVDPGVGVEQEPSERPSA